VPLRTANRREVTPPSSTTTPRLTRAPLERFDRESPTHQAAPWDAAVSRRTSLTWASTSLPEVRGQWCNALDEVIERHSAGLTANAVSTSDHLRLRRLQAKLATTIEIMKAECEALREAELYWVARDMVDVALDAALTLPESTAAVAAPCPNGLLCWTKPAGVVPYGPASTATAKVPWDGVW